MMSWKITYPKLNNQVFTKPITWRMKSIIFLTRHTSRLNQVTELLILSQTTRWSTLSTTTRSNHLGTSATKDRHRIFMILLSGQLCKLIPLITKGIFLHSMLSMRWLTHLIPMFIPVTTQRGKKWTSHNTTGKREKTTPLETCSIFVGRRTILMAKLSWDYLRKGTIWETDQTQCQHTTLQKKKTRVSLSRPTRLKLISASSEPQTTWQPLKTQWEWRAIKFTTRMINMTRGRNQAKYKVQVQEDTTKEDSWLIGKIDQCLTQRRRWRKRESRWSNKCYKMKRRQQTYWTLSLRHSLIG